MKYRCKIDKRTGTIMFLNAPPPDFRLVGLKRERFSEIVPTHWALLGLFRLLRRLCGETGRVSEWTRRWPCHWECTILMGHHRGRSMRSAYRAHLIEWEQHIWRRYATTTT